MKQVLIVDETPLFRDYLRNKLEENGIETAIAISAMDATSKIRTLAPDLIILDYHLSRQGFMEVLKQKKADINSVNKPVIILAESIDQKKLVELVPYDVKKVFTKPVKVDAIFATISELLGISMTLDDTPSIMDVHVNDSIIFIEIAKGLNRDKIDLLRYKIAELIELYEIRVPKVIIMLSDIKLGFTDTPVMKKLLSTVLSASKAKQHYVRILTRDDFVLKFIQGKKEFSEITVVENLPDAVEGLLSLGSNSDDFASNKAEIIGDRVLQAKNTETQSTVELKFDTEVKNTILEIMKDSLQGLNIAVIDDDELILEQVKNTFNNTGAILHTFTDGSGFLKSLDFTQYDLAFLDLNMPNVDGIEVLKVLQTRDTRYPVIILSANLQRETMLKTIQLGVKSYLIKPLKQEDIYRKSMEILKSKF